jgi:histidinol dehydrogenase
MSQEPVTGLRIVGVAAALARAGQPAAEVPPEVPAILEEIRREGDAAVRRWAAQLDGFGGPDFEVSRDAVRQAVADLDPTLRGHLEEAIRRVRAFAERQRAMFADLVVDFEGVAMGHRVVPVRRTACYVPGGRYPLPSSLLMSVVPARVAGVDEVYVLSPRIHPVTVAAAGLAGAGRVFNLGGAHGVAAAAWGLAGLPRADLVVGPGNRFVTGAKRLLYGDVGIDFPAGPSELMILADGTAEPALVAADLLAQAEHDVDAVPLLASFDPLLPPAVNAEIRRQLADLPADSPARESLANGFAVEVADDKEAVALADALAPEHLELLGPRAEALAPRLRAYGSLFVGRHSAEVFGDYGSGANHILPTGSAARFTGGVWVGTFLRLLTWQRVLATGVRELVSQAAALADAEGLPAHAASARRRLNNR